MSTYQSNDLRQRYYGLLFRSRETEQRYREWRIVDAIPFVRVGMIAGLLSQFLFVLTIYGFAPEQLYPVLTYLWASSLTTLVTLALTLIPSMSRFLFPVTAVTNTLTGLVFVWLAHEVVMLPIASARTPYMLTSCLILNFYAFTIFRLPLLAACVAVLPYIALTVFFIVDDSRLNVIPGIEAIYLFAYLAVGLISSVLCCCMLSAISRRNFISQQAIARQQKLISRYVPPGVSTQIIAGKEADIDAPQRRRVTVLFSDIVGFTDMADRLDAESLTQILNEYMSAMADIVEQYGGTLNEFAGDGLMALFGAPAEMSPEDQAVNALQAAQEMQSRLPSLNEQWLKLGIGEPMQFRVGIETGVLSVGSFGSEGRMTYTAASLQLLKGRIECEPRGDVDRKGVHYPVTVYAPTIQTSSQSV